MFVVILKPSIRIALNLSKEALNLPRVLRLSLGLDSVHACKARKRNHYFCLEAGKDAFIFDLAAE